MASSIRASSANGKPGSMGHGTLAPAAATTHSGAMSLPPDSSCTTPRLIVLRANPVARAVALTPPWP